MTEIDHPVANDTLSSTSVSVVAAYFGSGPVSTHYEVKKLGWNTPSDYMTFVSSHWKSFDAPNPFLHYMLGVIYIFFMFAALCGNGVVIWVFTGSKSLRTSSNMFIVNLAVLDFIMMLKTPVFIINSFNQGPIWGKLGCDIFALIGSYSGFGGALTNAAIAYDRYKTIAKPFDPKISCGKAFLMLVGIWAYISPWCLLPLFGIWGRYVPEGFLTTCTIDYLTPTNATRAFVASCFFFCYIVPALLIMYYYTLLYSHVKAHEKAMREQAHRMNITNIRSVGTKEEQEKSAEIRIAKVCMGLFFMYMVSWTPYAVVALIGAFGDRSVLTPLVSMLPALNCKMVACIDPWIYAINHPKYRLELQKRLPWFCVHEENPRDNAYETASSIEKA